MGSATWITVFVLMVTAIGLFGMIDVAEADHSPGHRVFINGVVTNADGIALGGIDILIECPQCGVATSHSTVGKTDDDGNYEVRFHVHDSDDGTPFTITATGGSPEKSVSKDLNLNLPGTTEARVESGEEWTMVVDLELDISARPLWQSILIFSLAGAAVIGLAYGGAVFAKNRKAAAAAAAAASTRKGKKGNGTGSKKGSKPDQSAPAGMAICSECAAKVKEENLARHLKKVHNQ